ncbi:MAG: cytochrome c [Chloroflexi bacterium]|nr:cytochrome c [Chloroflexota bacterium]
MINIWHVSRTSLAGCALLVLAIGCTTYAAPTVAPATAPTAAATHAAPTQSSDQPASANGRQIYFTATSQRGAPITSDLQVGMMGSRTVACVTCHGPDARGGPVRFMMYSFDAPDIRYETLSSQAMAEDHPPYTDATLKRAITQGVDPGGHPLEAPMPHWSMSPADLDDLIAYLKTLK